MAKTESIKKTVNSLHESCQNALSEIFDDSDAIDEDASPIIEEIFVEDAVDTVVLILTEFYSIYRVAVVKEEYKATSIEIQNVMTSPDGDGAPDNRYYPKFILGYPGDKKAKWNVCDIENPRDWNDWNLCSDFWDNIDKRDGKILERQVKAILKPLLKQSALDNNKIKELIIGVPDIEYASLLSEIFLKCSKMIDKNCEHESHVKKLLNNTQFRRSSGISVKNDPASALYSLLTCSAQLPAENQEFWLVHAEGSSVTSRFIDGKFLPSKICKERDKLFDKNKACAVGFVGFDDTKSLPKGYHAFKDILEMQRQASLFYILQEPRLFIFKLGELKTQNQSLKIKLRKKKKAVKANAILIERFINIFSKVS